MNRHAFDVGVLGSRFRTTLLTTAHNSQKHVLNAMKIYMLNAFSTHRAARSPSSSCCICIPSGPNIRPVYEYIFRARLACTSDRLMRCTAGGHKELWPMNYSDMMWINIIYIYIIRTK